MGNGITFEWLSVATEGTLAAFAAVLLVASAFARGKRSEHALAWVGVAGIAVALVMSICCPPSILSPNEAGLYFGNTLGMAQGFSVFALSCALLTAVMSTRYFNRDGGHAPEFMSVLMICAASLIIFIRANNLMLSFVALETATVCFYAMAAWNKNRAESLESAVKYLVVGGVSGAMFLMGIAFIYGAGLSAHAAMLNFEYFASGLSSPLFIAGLVFVASSVFFKIAAFPFQFWTPDVYQGAPAPVSAFLAVASKGAGLVFLMKIFAALGLDQIGDYSTSHTAVIVISTVAALTIIVGNLGGLTQTNVKRLIAFSGVSNAGYMLVLIAAVAKTSSISIMAQNTLFFYLAAYMFANYGLFFVINQFSHDTDAFQSFADYRGMLRGDKTLSSTVIVGLASLAGIPPTAGFLGKVFILVVAIYAQLYWLAAILIAGSAASIYYYFGWIRAVCDNYTPSKQCLAMPAGKFAPLMFGLSVASVFFGAIFICATF